MSFKTENEHGTITIDNEVISRIAGSAAMDCYGIVGMGAKSVKDGLVHLLKIESLTKGVKLSAEENKIVLELHIIVEYGTNIPAIADTLINGVKYKIEEFVGLEVAKINIFVEGVRVDI